MHMHDKIKCLNEAKAIFIDLDGTLLDDKKLLVSEKNEQFIKETLKNKHLIISTARGFDYKVFELIKNYPFEYLILYNGAKIYKRFKVVETNYMNMNDVHKVVEYVSSRKLNFVIFDEQSSNIYGYNNFQNWLMSFALGVTPTHINNISVNNSIYKMSLIMKSPFAAPKFIKQLRELFPELDIMSSSANFVIEVTAKKCTKGDAAQQVCKLLNIDPKDAIHIGDSMTDASCIGKVGCTIAMGNSSNAFKRVTNHHAPKYKKGGIYKLFNAQK